MLKSSSRPGIVDAGAGNGGGLNVLVVIVKESSGMSSFLVRRMEVAIAETADLSAR
jgi:hypothetical protein